MSKASSDPTQSFLSKSDQQNDSNEAHICIDTVSHGIKGSPVRDSSESRIICKVHSNAIHICADYAYCAHSGSVLQTMYTLAHHSIINIQLYRHCQCWGDIVWLDITWCDGKSWSGQWCMWSIWSMHSMYSMYSQHYAQPFGAIVSLRCL